MSRDVPTVREPQDAAAWFEAFDQLVHILRTDCPWDRKQTHDSISHMLIEECYETLEAISDKNDRDFPRELGDLLLHIVMHSVMAEERGAFDVRDVIKAEFDKLVQRHPHVFGDVDVADADAVKQNWEQIKMREGRRSALEGVPRHMPAVLRAQRIQEKAANVGFDWSDKKDVWRKVHEEIDELQRAAEAGKADEVELEFGDVLFSLINAARHENIVGEEALQATNNKFIRRFQFIEDKAAERGVLLKDMTLAEMDALWDQAKHEERHSTPDSSH